MNFNLPLRERVNNIKIFGILFLTLILGFFLRSFNLDFPSIGYHNMKENEYLSMAEEMQRTGDFTTRRIYFHNAFAENPDMQIFPQVPLVTYQILASWNLFGQNLWGARLFNVLFGVCSILTIYFLGLILFQSFRLALFCSFLLAIMPLGVFFSRNLQPESPGFLFMLLAHLFYLRYVTMSRRTDLFLGGTFFSLSWIYKMNFAFSALFFLFIFPYGKFFSRSRGLVKNIFALTLSYVPVLLSIAWLAHLGQWKFMQQTTIARVNLLEIFSPTYWNKYGKIIWWYIQGENFSLIFTILAVLGLFAAFLKRRSVLDRYLIGGVVSILCYSMFFSDFINQHNYYQMPFLGWVCISSTYGLLYISQLAKRAARKDVLGYLLSLVVFVSIFFVYSPIKRMYSTAFYGADVAGESVKEFTDPGEKFFLLTYSQGYAIARYAQRYAGWADNLNDFKAKEKKYNIKYICVYPPFFLNTLQNKSPELFNYIQDNYHLKELGFLDNSGEVIYFLVERGSGEIFQERLKSFPIQPQMRNIYKMGGDFHVFYTARIPSQ